MKRIIGANLLENGECEFAVWVPFAEKVELKLISVSGEETHRMQKDDWGYWVRELRGVEAGVRYEYVLNSEKTRPDPASYYQPEGVHSASELVDHTDFRWADRGWSPGDLSGMIIYELHIGTFTDEGTFEAVIPRLDDLVNTGVNAIQIMPVAQFPGTRNWGYDGVYPYAVQNSYGGPRGLKTLVDECHKRKINVIMDVVYNHLGPEGNYLWDYGPYFTDRYKTPWGDALNFDGPYSDGVRNFFIRNAIYWLDRYHIDALRVDAVHAFFDMSAYPFLKELVDEVDRLSARNGRRYGIIAESALNDVRIINPGYLGGFGYDAQWSDDLHHSLHTVLTGEKHGYYIDFGRIQQLAESLREGFVYKGQYSEFRKRRHGNNPESRPFSQFIVYSQNHDQVGNRAYGERLSALTDFEGLKVAAGVVILSPFVPMLFMGEEYGERSPFYYFVSPSDPCLAESVREGRKKEFAGISSHGELPDPQAEETYLSSKLDWDKRYSGMNRALNNYYKKLIDIRKSESAITNPDKDCIDTWADETNSLVFLKRWHSTGTGSIFCVFNLNNNDSKFEFPQDGGIWNKVIESGDSQWGGPGSSHPDKVEAGSGSVIRGLSMVMYRAS